MAAAVFVVEGFGRWMRKQVLRENDLCRAVGEMTRGLVDADLGSGLFKKRIARSGAGKSGGYRALVANRRDGPWFFVEGYAKNKLDNVDHRRLRASRSLGQSLMAMTGPELEAAVASHALEEVNCDAQAQVRSR